MRPLYTIFSMKARKFIILWVVAVFCGGSLFAQSIESIKASSKWLWGEGNGETLEEADQRALRDLGSQISLSVVSSTQTEIENQQYGDEAISSTRTKGTTQIGSNVTLNNCQRIVTKHKNSYQVLRYIEKSEIDKMYERLEQKIRELVEQAKKAEAQEKIGDALRFNYWAFKLISALPTERQYALRGENGMLMSELTSGIAEMMNAVQVEAKGVMNGEDNKTVELRFVYKGKPMVNGDFYYNDGSDWMPTKIKDGVGVAEIPNHLSRFNVRLEYEYRYLWKSDPTVQTILQQNPQLMPFPGSSKSVLLSSAPKQETQFSSVKELTKTIRTDAIGYAIAPKDIKHQAKIIYPIVDAIETKHFDAIRPYFTEEGWKWYEKLVKFGNAKIIEKPELLITAFEDGYLVRGVKANFSFKKNNTQFVEDLVFYLKDDLVQAVNFGLEQSAIQDIKSQGGWNDTSRLVLINFLENYKTAYALERLDYLEAVFSDDALIIVGNKVPQKRKMEIQAEDMDLYNKKRLTKSEYIAHMRQVFDKQEFVNIHFEDASVKKTSRKNERYQILIKQIYSSATYADTGYLFLLADLTDPKNPIIHVRVWDEQKNNLMNYGEWNY